MAAKTLKYGGNTLAFILVVFGIIVLINFLSSRRFVRADLTAEKRYTISQSTKKVLKRLDDIVTIDAYFSRQPARVAQIRQSVRDMLEEYRAFSKNLQINFIDPAAEDEAEKQKLRFMGIPEVQVNVIEKDKAEVANVYMGIAILYADKKEVLPVVQTTANLEYDLTSAILKVTSKEVKTIGFLTGHDEIDVFDQAFGPLRQELSKQYDVRKVPIDAGKAIDPDVATLVIAGPKKELTEREKYEIDQFIMRGGRALFLIDPILIQYEGLNVNPLQTGLNDLLEHYGVKLNDNLVLDVSMGQLVYSQGFMTVTTGYAYFIKVLKQYQYRTGETSDGLSQDSIITNQLESLTLNWASSLELLPQEDASVEAIALAKTSRGGWTAQSPYNISPTDRQFQPPASVQQAHTVAVSLSGVFKSFYAGKAIPPVESSESDEAVTAKPAEEERTTKTDSEATQIVVVGNSQFLQQGQRDGQLFFLNTVDWLTLGEELINIRSHGATNRPLKEISESEKFFLKFISIAGVPILVIAFGLVRFFLRRRAKRMVEAYGSMS
jgi:gliding-associated putative ABC transporter substrate-binding component GldG